MERLLAYGYLDFGGDYVREFWSPSGLLMILFASLGVVGFIFSLLLKNADRKEMAGIELPTKIAQT